ncbi:MAG: hypothetical protein ACYC8T_37565 [Myxococcaceae bacterium]
MRPFFVALMCLALAPTGALAEDDDAPIPFPDEDEGEGRRALPRRSEETATIREESDYEQMERDETMAGFDDPNIGISGEFLIGLMLLDSSRGQGVESRASWGVRATWEFGRLLADETLRDALFADVTWQYAGMREGTGQPGSPCVTAADSCLNKGIYGDTNYHYFTLAPAYAFKLGKESPLSVYAQVGVGLGYQFSSVHAQEVETQIAGTKALLQYGVGFRGRPAVAADGSVRISFRVELTRFRRGYMDDTFLGGSIGVTF